jgi:ABC-type sugar transport system ATPase subunit
MSDEKLLDMVNISKSFSGIQALDNANFELYKGQIHALMGANGAGKSTLIKILCGVYQPDSGIFKINNKLISIKNPFEAQKNGIAYVPQEIAVQPYMTVAENIFLGKQPMKNIQIDFKKMSGKAQEILDDLGIDVSINKLGINLSIAEKQLITIAKVISAESKILIFDEATSALTLSDTDKLFKIIRRLKQKGIGIIYVTHRMEEIFQLCDWVTVFKDGKFVSDSDIKDIDLKQLIKHMIGREIASEVRRNSTSDEREPSRNEERLSISNLCVPGMLQDITFSVKAGEVLGLAGLVGSGRTELLRAIFGDLAFSGGTIKIDGKAVKINNCTQAINEGIALVPEDRKAQGLILNFSLKKNISMTILDKLKRFGLINSRSESELAKSTLGMLDIKFRTIEQTVNTLSGGNQQRVVLGKWLATNPKILLVDEPTRGVDVSAKSEIHNILFDLAKNGMAIIVVSSELGELLQVCEKVLILNRGRIVAELLTKDTNTHEMMELATGESTTKESKSNAF